MKITEKPGKIADISVLEVYDEDQKGIRPLILVYHGYLGNKEAMLHFCRILAQNGFFAVAVDAYKHGERSIPGYKPTLLEGVLNSVEEVNSIISGYDNSDLADNTRTGLAGGSMGGMIVFGYMAQDDCRAKAAFTLVSTPNWLSVVSKLVVTDTNAYTEELKQKEIKIAEEMQPSNKYKSFGNIPLLMINGEVDSIVPIKPVEEFYSLVKENCGTDDNIKLIIYPGVDHLFSFESELGTRTYNEMVSWFDKFLK